MRNLSWIWSNHQLASGLSWVEVQEAWASTAGTLLKTLLNEWLLLALGADANLAAWLDLEAWAIYSATVDENVTMNNHLACSWNGWRQSDSPDQVVEARLEHCDQVLTRWALAPCGLSHVALELLLSDAIVEAKLLLLSKTNLVVAGLAATTSGVLTRRILTIESGHVGQTRKYCSQCTTNLYSGSTIASHNASPKKRITISVRLSLLFARIGTARTPKTGGYVRTQWVTKQSLILRAAERVNCNSKDIA